MSLGLIDGAEHRIPSPPLLAPSSFAPVYVTPGRYGSGVTYQMSVFACQAMRWTVPAVVADPEIWWGMAFRPNRSDGAVGGTEPLMVVFGDGVGATHLTVYANAAGALSLYRGTSAGTLLGTTSNGQVANNTWVYLELYAHVDNLGAYELRVNGVNVLSASGVDTRNGGTSPNVTTIGSTYVHNPGILASAQPQIDDLYLMTGDGAGGSGFQSEIIIERIAPSAAGNYTQLTPSAGSNWQNVDEVPFSSSDYNGSPTPGQKDTYAYTNLVSTTGTIVGTVLHTATMKNNAGFITGRRVIRIGGSDYNGADYPSFSATMVPHSEVLEVSPATAAAWTISEVNGTEAGFEVRSI